MLSNKEISNYRKEIRNLIDKIDRLAFYSAYPDPLFKGTPGEVFRKCGKPGCKCARNPASRHGPYLVVQIRENGKSKQIALRQEQKPIWLRAKNYQNQIKKVLELRKCFGELEELILKIIENRTEEMKNDG